MEGSRRTGTRWKFYRRERDHREWGICNKAGRRYSPGREWQGAGLE